MSRSDLRPIARLETIMKNGITHTRFALRADFGLQEVLAHDTAACAALAEAQEENRKLKQRVELLERLVRSTERIGGAGGAG